MRRSLSALLLLAGLAAALGAAGIYLGQTLACLPGYARQENLADLWVETARARCQLRQLTTSFFGSF